ncbi:MAG: putative peptidoglycan binding domain, partial [Candidatus Parcubacteria bacterium]
PLRWGACINPLGTSTTESASSSSSVELSAITAFYSKQSSIVLGKTASLFWSVNPNYQCSIKNLTTGVVELQIVTSSGVKIISPKQTTRYSLSCFKKEDPTVAPLEQSLVVSVIKADIAPKVNKMSCDNQVSSSLKSGDVACYGIWDREDDFGGDKNICWSSQGGCRVTAKACSSSGATLKEVIEIGKASPESLEQVATKLGVTTSVLQNSAIKVWVYACDGAVQTFSTSSISLNAENTHYGSILGATTECVDVQSSMLSLESTDATHRGDVSKVQRFLQEKGYFFRDITGYYGGYTKKAVEKYQTSKNITPSGNIGTTTKLLIKNDTCG